MRLNIGRKMAGGFGSLLGLLAVLSLVILINLNGVENQFRFVVEHDARVIANAQLLAKLVVDMETGQRGFVITGKDEFLQPYNEGITEFEKILKIEKELVSDNPSQVKALEKIEDLVHEWQDKAAKPEMTMRRSSGVINAEKLLEELNSSNLELYSIQNNMQHTMAAVQESFAYIVSGKEIEKDEFLEWADKLDVTAEKFRRLDRLDSPEEEFEKKLFEEIALEQLNLVNAAKVMFNELETKGSVSNKAFIEYEDIIDKLSSDFARFIEIEKAEALEAQSGTAVLIRASHKAIEAKTGKNILDQIRVEFKKFIQLENALTARRYANAAETAENTRNITIILTLVAVIFGAIVTTLITRGITKPVRELVNAIEITARGDLSSKIETNSKDEIGQLATAFNQMLEDLRRLEEERKQAEEQKTKLEVQLRQSQRMQAIGTLAGGIAHDFNNILWVIMGNTEMSLRKLPEDSPIRAKQQEILTASKRAQELIEQILTFSRQKEQESKPLQIHLIVRETVKLLAATLPSTIKIRQKIDKDSGMVIADPTELHQMIMNLCTNAYQAMGENGGLLEVSLGVLNGNSKTTKSYSELQEGSYIGLTISDTGCGMDKATVERIFEPFFTTREVGEGTGLGLATVHGIVTSLGGAIRVDSKPGKGSKIRVFLPRHDFSVSEPMAEADSPVLKGNERVLYVDDEKQIVSIAQDMLEKLGYHITTYTSSVEALKQFSAQPDKFDLVITDQTMPDMTGMEFSEQVLNIRPDIPVILATGFSKLVTEEKIKNIGISEYLKKPIVFHDLEKVVRRVLDDNKDND